MNFEEQGILAGLKKRGPITRALQAAGIAQMPTSQTMGFAAGGVIDEQTHPELAGSVTASTSIQPSTSAVLAPKQSAIAASLPNFGDNSSAGLNARLQFMQNQNAGGQIGDASKPLDSNPAISPTESLPLNAGAPRETTWQEDTDARQARINDMASSLKTMEANGRANSLMGSSSSITRPALGFADGGKIKGPGTPTSDSIPARVRETGEPIKVSTGERIVSHAQEGILQGIAQKMGFKNLDQLLEAKTGKPVGPTIKGGIAAAADGLSPETDPDTDGRRQYSASGAHGVSQNVGIAAKPKTIDIGGIPHLDLPDQKYPGPLSMAASAAAGTIGHVATAPFGNRAEERLAANRAELNNETAEPQAKTKPAPSTSGITGGVQAVANQGIADLAGRQAGHMIDNNLRSFEDKGNSTVRQVGANGKIEFTNVGTADVTDPTKKVQVNSYDGAGDNESMAKANAIRQALIDRQPQGGLGILGDGGVEAANAEKTQRWRQDELLQQANRGNQGAIAAIIHGNAQASTELIRGQNQLASEQGRNAVAVRGQDMLAQNEAARLAGNPVDNQLKQAQAQGIAATTDSVREQADLRSKLLSETDPAKRTAMQEAMLLAQGRDPSQGRFIRMGGGEQVVDPMTGQKAKLPDQIFDSRTGQTVQTGKRALTDADFAAIGKKIGLSADALKARYGEFQKQGPATSLKDFSTVDVALALADGTPPEKIAGTIKRLGGNPAEYGL